MKKVFLAVVAVMGLAFYSVASDGYSIDSSVADFKLKNIDGKIVSLSDYPAAKGFIITFTCNHCPYAKAYEDRIVALNKKYAVKGYPVIAINPNDAVQYPEDNFDNMKLRAEEKKFTFPYLVDETQEIAKTFGAIKTPHIYVVQKEGKNIKVKYIGAIDDNWENPEIVNQKYVEDAVNALLNNKEVVVKTTKAIGCSIKWKKQ
ncbi:MAG: thioredoxin family protein [Chitinophagales bacterium]